MRCSLVRRKNRCCRCGNSPAIRPRLLLKCCNTPLLQDRKSNDQSLDVAFHNAGVEGLWVLLAEQTEENWDHVHGQSQGLVALPGAALRGPPGSMIIELFVPRAEAFRRLLRVVRGAAKGKVSVPILYIGNV
jgi:hypothetical protein